MNINYIPVVGWIISLFFSAVIAVPFWIIYTLLGIGEKYFFFLPEVYQVIPFWNIVGLFMVINILRTFLFPSFINSNVNGK